MRYSLVLPRSESTDSAETRKSLEAARELLAGGDERGALQWVRKAAWAAAKSGQDARALALSKAAKSLQASLEASAGPAMAKDEVPGVLTAPPRGEPNALPPESRETVRGPRPEKRTSQRPPRESARPSQRPPRKESGRSSPRQAAVKESGRSSSRHGAVKESVARPSQRPSGRALRDSDAKRPAAGKDGEATLDGFDSAMDLVVTVAPGEWAATGAATLVGHRAMRVAIADGKNGTFVVRPLTAGEVAPRNTRIAILVSLEPGASSLPRTG
jgi:hypothetical protein